MPKTWLMPQRQNPWLQSCGILEFPSGNFPAPGIYRWGKTKPMFYGIAGWRKWFQTPFFPLALGLDQAQLSCSQGGGNQEGLKGFWELIQSPGIVWVGRSQRPSRSSPFCLQNTALTQNLRFCPLFLPWNCCFSTEESHPDFPARLCSVPGRRNCWKFRNKNSLLRLWATNLGWNVALVVPIQFFFCFFPALKGSA